MFVRNLVLALLFSVAVLTAPFASGHEGADLENAKSTRVRGDSSVSGLTHDQLPVTRLAKGQACSSSIEEAVRLGLKEAMSLDGRFEWGGVILQRTEGCFQHTSPVTNENPAAVRYRIAAPKGAKVVGLYHTHPGSDESHMFSLTDMEMVRAMKVPSFIGISESRQVRQLSPGFSDRSDIKLRFASGIHPGHEGRLLGQL